jgi:hypothetical protein
MRIRYLYYFAFIVIVLAVAGALKTPLFAETGDVKYNEYQVKAAFLYNFIKFTEWPEDKPAEPNVIIIGILGEDKFKDSFDAIKDKPINNQKILIKSFGKFSQYVKNGEDSIQLTPEAEQLKKCHILFICDSEWAYTREIIEAVKGGNVLTVGETGDFLELGGIITFVPSNEKLAFEVNYSAAKKNGLQINSRVLRLAKRVINN